MITPEKQVMRINPDYIEEEESKMTDGDLSTKKPTFEEMMKNLQEEADYLALRET